jgi:hypothetical protein
MDLQIVPSKEYNLEPFFVNAPYNDTVENLIYRISLTLTDVSVNSIILSFRGKRLEPVSKRLNELGISNLDQIDLIKAPSGCCNLI